MLIAGDSVAASHSILSTRFPRPIGPSCRMHRVYRLLLWGITFFSIVPVSEGGAIA
jgi:hypothetical protein